MCFVGTTTGITSVIKGDTITYDKDMGTYVVFDNGKINGVFDLSSIEYLFLSQKKDEQNELR